jgi:pyruvate,water dikinase
VISDPTGDISEAYGGKALGLGRLRAAGMPVPDVLALNRDDVQAFVRTGPPKDLARWLGRQDGTVAVRSSAQNEDGDNHSFAGMYRTSLRVSPTLEAVTSAVLDVASSGDSERIRSYVGDEDTPVSVIPIVIQRMIEPSVAGVLFTSTISDDGRDAVYIEWVDGDGEKLVGGQVTPSSIIIPWSEGGSSLDWSGAVARRESLEMTILRSLTTYVQQFIRSYPGSWDIEWAADSLGGVWMLQARPQTRMVFVSSRFDHHSGALGVVPGIAQGRAFITDDEGDTQGVQRNDVLVAEITEVDSVPAMRRAAAIVTENGGLLSHAAIIARELNKPCVVGLTGARRALVAGEQATVDGSAGTVTQNHKIIGGSSVTQQLDWRSIALYDRGLDLTIDDQDVYVEFLPSGLVGYIADELPPAQQDELQIQLRRYFGQPADLVVDQKPLWSAEWHRFRGLDTFALIEGALLAPLARWHRGDLAGALKSVRAFASDVGLEITRNPSGVRAVFYRELGAALHSLIGSLIEGYGQWFALRASVGFLYHSGHTLNQLIEGSVPDPPDPLLDVLSCLTVLAEERNSTYTYFRQVNAFDLEYFSDRDEMLSAAIVECELPADSSLDDLYSSAEFRLLDRESHARAISRLWGS